MQNDKVYKGALEDIMPNIILPDELAMLMKVNSGISGKINKRYSFKFSNNESQKMDSYDTENFKGIEFKSENILIFDDKNKDGKLYAGNIIFTYHFDTKIWSKSLFLACINDKSIGNRLVQIETIELDA